jgi:hypothetical protein
MKTLSLSIHLKKSVVGIFLLSAILSSFATGCKPTLEDGSFLFSGDDSFGGFTDIRIRLGFSTNPAVSSDQSRPTGNSAMVESLESNGSNLRIHFLRQLESNVYHIETAVDMGKPIALGAKDDQLGLPRFNVSVVRNGLETACFNKEASPLYFASEGVVSCPNQGTPAYEFIQHCIQADGDVHRKGNDIECISYPPLDETDRKRMERLGTFRTTLSQDQKEPISHVMLLRAFRHLQRACDLGGNSTLSQGDIPHDCVCTSPQGSKKTYRLWDAANSFTPIKSSSYNKADVIEKFTQICANLGDLPRAPERSVRTTSPTGESGSTGTATESKEVTYLLGALELSKKVTIAGDVVTCKNNNQSFKRNQVKADPNFLNRCLDLSTQSAPNTSGDFEKFCYSKLGYDVRSNGCLCPSGNETATAAKVVQFNSGETQGQYALRCIMGES